MSERLVKKPRERRGAAAVALSCLLALGAPRLLLAGEIPATMDPALVPNYKRVRPGLATAGQPTPEALKQLKELGLKTVINLRTSGEPGVKEEEELARALGLDYVSVPITPASFSAEDARAVGRLLEDEAAGPILLHCVSANRVGGVVAVIRAQGGMPYDEALAEGKAVGLASPAMVEAVERVLGRRDRPKQP